MARGSLASRCWSMAFTPGRVQCDSVWLSPSGLGPAPMAKCGGVRKHREATFLCLPPAPCLPHQLEVRRALSDSAGSSKSWDYHDPAVSPRRSPSLTGSQFASLSHGGDDGLFLRAVLPQGRDETEQIKHLAEQTVIILIIIISFNDNL